MRTEQTHCDKCQRLIGDHEEKPTIVINTNNAAGQRVSGRFVDLCRTCYPGLLKWLANCS